MKYLFHPVEARAGKLFELDADSPAGWYTTPAAFGVITCPSVDQMGELAAHSEEPLSKDDLLALAEQRGITVDKRWGIERLKAALNGDGT